MKADKSSRVGSKTFPNPSSLLSIPDFLHSVLSAVSLPPQLLAAVQYLYQQYKAALVLHNSDLLKNSVIKEVLSLVQNAWFHQEGCSPSFSRTLQTKHTVQLLRGYPSQNHWRMDTGPVLAQQHLTLKSNTQKIWKIMLKNINRQILLVLNHCFIKKLNRQKKVKILGNVVYWSHKVTFFLLNFSSVHPLICD